MKRKSIFIIFMVFSLVFIAGANAKTMVLQLPVYDSAGQFWLDENNNLKGFRVQVLEELNKILSKDDIKLEYKITKYGNIPIKRCISEILEGNYDAYFGLIYSKAREDLGLRFSKEEMYSIPTVVWMNRSNEFNFSNLDSLKGKKVGIVKGYPYLQDIKNSNFILDNGAMDDSTNVKKLVSGRVDAIIDNIIRTGSVIDELGVSDKISYAKKPFQTSKFQIAYNKNVPQDVVNKIDAALAQLHGSGTIQKILDENIYNRLKK
ncbi:MAG: transporter substrate-binding domain-containing protein [Desulfobacterales bacterium]|nr:transporter substrate-binding domain-containing protein [Desulfobacterales bacterium]